MNEQQEIELIKKFSNLSGVAGFEMDVAKFFQQQVKAYGKTHIDGMFNSYVERRQNTGDRTVVQLDAHADSVGFITQAVRPNGLLKFVPLGGWVPTNIPAMKVRVRNRVGQYIKGVVATKPPHFMTTAERNAVPVIADLSIDVGSTSREETINDFQIDTGCPIFVDVDCEYFPSTRMFFGKDFDNRVGAAALVSVLDQLDGQDLEVDVSVALSTQEEVGTRGAQVTARNIDPDVAIVFEGCPCDDTFSPEWLAQTGLKRGPMLRDMDTSFIANPFFEQYADDLATAKQIPHTRSVRTGGGVNGAPILYYRGAPTIVVGIPVRYEHTAYNWANLDDFQNAVRLVSQIIASLDEKTIASFKCES
ncbi:M42 family metallopeptidase [Bombilactobacillus thymidiniphilus]|uniref:M42 family peptidase n=1 Tax=Bombilactobacillus thymidiniphilus TaxID=2923363 RepID=A0ABY4PBC7_9LACO|nr:M42 family peptidase [Bombilactobacillus thymidiniphilus]UQS82982.1 M42 family peptidase [Bombilactobacillus thymidiniphilus]